MKNKLIIATILSIFMTACNSQAKIDLADIVLPLDKSTIINDNYQLIEGSGKMLGLNYYYSFDDNLLFYNNKDIGGRITETVTEIVSANGVTFYVHESKIVGIDLKTYVKSEMILDLIQKKLGKPEYYENTRIGNYMVWEDKQKEQIYLLKYKWTTKVGGIKTNSISMTVLNINDMRSISAFGASAYSYYIEYLEYRNKNNKSDYSYADFAREEGSDMYLKTIPKD